jgi:serine/threonine protein kinase
MTLVRVLHPRCKQFATADSSQCASFVSQITSELLIADGRIAVRYAQGVPADRSGRTLTVGAVLKKSGEPIPGYKLVQRIGAGGYGEVWTAEAPGGLVKAIKFVYGLLDEDRATREMKALQRIKGVRHPFLLSIERIEIIDGQLIFVTELADNSLKDRFDICRKEGRPGIPRDELLQHLRDTADALDYMSEHHCLQHLDVKPENLLLSGGRIKVADFGLVKDLHEASASMMGGLTPIYAPPEVFEGRPCKFSDQYSLAIVYQEMLSGVLPFPGKTAAQLAAQHLNAKPRMAALPEADQQVIGKSLSKNPTERFASCREMVAALNRATQQIVAARMTHSRGELAAAMNPHITQGATQANISAPATAPVTEQEQAPLSYATEARTPDHMLASLEQASQAANALQEESRLLAHAEQDIVLDLEQPRQATDAPPPAFDALPTLIVGVGGLGGKVAGRLKQMFSEQPLEVAVQTLILDTDRRDSLEAAQSSGTSTCRNESLLHLPLRKSCDYRDDSRKMLEWLGRRWLYNIPRSQLTEGLRPLGRLALVDHSDQIWRKFRTKLQELMRPLPESDQPQTPRVVVVAGSGGGTGGGMVIDIVAGLQQLLAELKCNGSEISVVLAHSTPRTAAGVQLAISNTCSLLAEWDHSLRQGAKFPGDPACGLKPRTIETPPRTRVIHLGDELSNDDFDAACEKLADLIAAEISTAADSCFHASEQKPPVADTETRHSAWLRTAGLVRVGFTQDDLAKRAMRRLCHGLIARWIGKPHEPERSSIRATSILPSRQTQSNSDCLMKNAFLDLQAQQQAAAWGLDAESLMSQLLEQAGSKVAPDTGRFFQDLTQAIARECGGNSPVQRWLATATELFGPRSTEGVVPGQATSIPALAQATESLLKERVATLGAALQQWLFHWLDDPQHRLFASQRTLTWFQTHFRALLDQLRDLRKRIAQETASLEQFLVMLPTDWKKAVASAKKSQSPDPANAFVHFCRLRLQDFAASLASKVIQALQSVLSGTGDRLVELNRELQLLSGLFDDGDEEPIEPGASPRLLGSLRKIVSEQLQGSAKDQAAVLDETITRVLLQPCGGMLSALTSGGDARSGLMNLIEVESRRIILRQLESLDISACLSEGAAIDPQLAADWRTLVEQAQPRWQGAAAQRRLLCIIPERSHASRDTEVWRKCLKTTSFHQPPALIDAPGADLLLCFEVGPLSVTDVLAQLLHEHPDLGEVAGRLHTRADVSWPEIVVR